MHTFKMSFWLILDRLIFADLKIWEIHISTFLLNAELEDRAKRNCQFDELCEVTVRESVKGGSRKIYSRQVMIPICIFVLYSHYINIGYIYTCI